jgi:hypothetical protein
MAVIPAPAFNPYGLHSIHIPLGLVRYRRVSWGAKLLYGRLALFLGRKPDGYCNPDLGTMAFAMGASVDTIERWLTELVTHGFIKRQRRQRQKAECIFLSHPCFFDSAVLPNQGGSDSAGPPNQDAPESADLPSRFRNSAVLDSANFTLLL